MEPPSKRRKAQRGRVPDPAQQPDANENNENSESNGDGAVAENTKPSTSQPARVTLVDLVRDTKSGIPTKSANTNDEDVSRAEAGSDQGPSPSTRTSVAPSFAPQVKIVDGKIVVNPSSLTVHAPSQADLTATFHTVKDGQNQMVTSSTYAKRTPADRWTPEETDKFYQALRQWGTDFTAIEKLFPNRQRRQIKNKFKKEEKLNRQKIDDALNQRVPIDIQDYRVKTGLRGEDEGGGEAETDDGKA